MPLKLTHRNGGTLDLVITKSKHVLVDMTVDAPDVISDYSVQISWCFPLSIVIKRDVRGWSKVNEDSCRAALLESELCT